MSEPAPNRVVRRDEYYWTAVDRDGYVVAIASRKGLGCMWNVWLPDEHRRTPSRSETVHVRVSGKLSATVQTKLIYAILENA